MHVWFFEFADFLAAQYILHAAQKRNNGIVWAMWAYYDYAMSQKMTNEEFCLFDEVTSQPIWAEARMLFEELETPENLDHMVYQRTIFKEDLPLWRETTVNWALSA
jgi:hypothetical protein